MGVSLKFRDNLAKVERDLDALAARIPVAFTRAANAMLGPVQTAGFQQIAITYQIPAATMKQFASQRIAAANDPIAGITVKGRGFPLSAFSPVQTAAGVSVLLKGRRVTIPHSFMVGKFGKHVFARGSYRGKYGGKPSGEVFGEFVFGESRLPISELWSLSPPDAFSNPATTAAMDAAVAERAPAALRRELSAIARGF